MARRLGSTSAKDDERLTRLAEGTLLAGRFEVLGLLGAGGMGTVYRARDREDGRVLALKVLALDDSGCIRRFRREFRIAARLHHPNLVAARSFHPGPPPFFTMEYVPGLPLNEWARADDDAGLNSPLRLERVRDLLGQLLAGLAYIHAQGLVHRDLKPENLLVTAAGRLRIMDFGVVRGPASSDRLTQGRIVGTLAYMAPEQLEGAAVDARSDLYSVGAVLYELLTGEPPFAEDQFGSLARAILDDSPPLPQSLNPGVDPTLAAFCTTLLAKKQWQRFASAEQALYVLDAKSAPPSTAPRRPPLLTPQFVGRDAELALLRELLAEDSPGGPLVITGPPGSGRSRLLGEASAVARSAGADGIVLRPQPNDPGPFAGLLPLFERLGGLPSGAEAEPGTAAHLMVARLTERGASAPLLLLLDDAEDFSAWSQVFLAALLRELWLGDAPSRVVLLAACREPSPESSLVAQALREVIGRQHIGTRRSLKPLQRDETEALVRSMLGETQVPPALVDWIHRETAGNPYFTEDTVRSLVESGHLVSAGGEITLNWPRVGRADRSELDVADFEGLPVPRGVRELVERSLSQLGSRAREVLGYVALAASDIEFDTLLAATGLDEDSLTRELDELIQARALTASPGGADAVRFVHEKLREIVVQELAPGAAREMHRRLGATLEVAPEAARDVIALARHFDACGERAACLRYLPAAARALSAARRHADSADAWARLLEFEPIDPASSYAARHELSRELGHVGRLPEARAVLESLLQEVRLPLERAAVLCELTFLESRLGNFSIAVARACEYLALARAHGDEGERARALRVLGAAHTQHGHFAEAERSFAEAAELFRRGPDRAGLTAALRGLGTAVGAQGRFHEAAERLQGALALLKGPTATLEEQSTLLELGTVHLNRGSLHAAIDCYLQSLELASRLGRGERIASAECNLAYALTLAGDYGEAERLLARALRYTADGRNAALEAAAWGNRAILRRHGGEFEGALEDARRARAALGDGVHAGLLAELDLERARIELALGRGATARRTARRALAIAHGQHLPWHEALARAALAELLQGPGALEQARRARALAEPMGAELLVAQVLAREAELLEAWGDPAAALAARGTAARIVRLIGRQLGARERTFLRTPVARAVLLTRGTSA